LNDQRVHKSVSGACGLTGFTVAILAGLAADNPANVILTRALVAMAACYGVGVFIGYLASRAVRDAITSHIIRNPAPAIEDVRQAARARPAQHAPGSPAKPRAEAA
jgi:hypothetical protein